MLGLLPTVDPDGLLEFSVLYNDHSSKPVSKQFGGVARKISRMLKTVCHAKSTALVIRNGWSAIAGR